MKKIEYTDCHKFGVITCYDVHSVDSGDLEFPDDTYVTSFFSEEEAINFVRSNSNRKLTVTTSQVIEIKLREKHGNNPKSVFFNFAGKNRVLEKINDERIEREAALAKLTDKEKKILGLI